MLCPLASSDYGDFGGGRQAARIAARAAERTLLSIAPGGIACLQSFGVWCVQTVPIGVSAAASACAACEACVGCLVAGRGRGRWCRLHLNHLYKNKPGAKRQRPGFADVRGASSNALYAEGGACLSAWDDHSCWDRRILRRIAVQVQNRILRGSEQSP
jgi:hypothetical protein